MVGFDRWYQAVSRSGSAYRRLAEAAFGPDQFVGQQGFATRDQLLSLAARTLQGGRGPLLDACCGAAGPARCLADRLQVPVVGLDLELSALRLASLPVVAGDAVNLPFADASFGAALLLDSVASISAPEALLAELARVLQPGAGLGMTAEIGSPLTSAEKSRFTRTAPPTVLEEPILRACLEAAGFRLIEVADHTPSALRVAEQLASGLATQRADLAKELGVQAVDDLHATLACLAELLATRRVAEKAVLARRASP